MKVRNVFLNVLGVAVLFGMSAMAQDSGSTAGKGGSPNSTSAKQSEQSKSSSSMDKQFASKAAQGGLAEVELGTLAKENGSDQAVKDFGDHMVTDHGKANSELESLAQQKGWKLPTKPKASDAATKERLAKKKGADFDKAYMRDMVMDHENDVKEFQKCASSCSDSDLKGWAAKTLPTLQDHLKMAKDDAEKIGALKSAKSSHPSSKKPSAATSEKPSGAIQ